MSVRVNLLRPDEIRYTGAVSKGAAIRWGGITMAVLAAAGVAWLIVSVRGTLHGLRRAQSRWGALEASYGKVREVQKQHLGNRGFLDELNGWGASRVEWEEALDDVQGMIPANIQLHSLSVEGDMLLIEPEKKPDEENEDPGTPARTYKIRVQGVAHGALSDKDVIQFVDRLRSAEGMKSWLAIMKLQGLQRMATRGVPSEEEEERRTFVVDASSAERLMQ